MVAKNFHPLFFATKYLQGDYKMTLRELRLAKGLSLRELARRTGLSHMTLSAIERKLVKSPHHLTILAISRVLRVNPWQVDEFRERLQARVNEKEKQKGGKAQRKKRKKVMAKG